MGCHDLIGRQWIWWIVCLLSTAWQTENRAKYAANMLWIFFLYFSFPLTLDLFLMRFPVSGFTGLEWGKWLLDFSSCLAGQCEFWSAGILTVPWQAEAVHFRATAVTAEHSFFLSGDPLLWEVTQAQRSCSCCSAAPALAAKKEVLPSGESSLLWRSILGYCRVSSSEEAGIGKFCFWSYSITRKGFSAASVPLKEYQA